MNCTSPPVMKPINRFPPPTTLSITSAKNGRRNGQQMHAASETSPDRHSFQCRSRCRCHGEDASFSSSVICHELVHMCPHGIMSFVAN
uniref:Uncharacterized protein n=1 Tax=Arundo donax TaxID=35708 RepID=A0A0A9GAH8_ARUDO